MSHRRIIVVDTETTGLDLLRHRPVEVGWLHWGGTGRDLFVPPHDLDGADPDALEINRYAERIAGRQRDTAYSHTARLHRVLTNAVLAGAGVRFDAAMLSHLFRDAGLEPVEPWHYRLLDVQAYAAGHLGIPPWALPSLRDLCQLLDLRTPTHTAMDDAELAAAVLTAVSPKGCAPCGA